MRPPGVPWLVALLLLGHLLFGLVRLPVGAVGKRAQAIASYEALGPAGWHFRLADAETRRIARWLGAAVPAGEVVLYDGDPQGSLQLLAPLLFPRLLVHASARRGDHDAAGRSVFAGRAAWLDADPAAVPVVVGSLQALRIEYR